MASCFVLIEHYLNGCRVGMKPVGVTLDQQIAYNWSQQETPVTVTRQIVIAPFLENP